MPTIRVAGTVSGVLGLMSSAASRPPFSASHSSYPTTGQTMAESASVSSAQSSAPSSSVQLSSAQSSISAAAQPAATATATSEPHPPKRPRLVGPPARPLVPKPVPERVKVSQKPPEPEVPKVIGPISKPSERMQYRAIGLLQGKYVASEEQFNRGNILLADGTLIDSVLLGRVTSLIKKHIDLETEHIWVVYPRTLYKEDEKEPALHMQIVGVWEPETLSSSDDSYGSDSKESGSKESDINGSDLKDTEAKSGDLKNSDKGVQSPRYLSTEEAGKQCDRFSIRGEVAKYSEENNEITINIVQKSKSENAKPKRPFKLLINGQLEGRTVGYFWDLKVKREGGELKLEQATQVGVVPPKKKPKTTRRSSDRKQSGSKSRHSAPKPAPKKKKAESAANPTEFDRASSAQAAEAPTTPALKNSARAAIAEPKPASINAQADKVAAETRSKSVQATHAQPTDAQPTGAQPTDTQSVDTQPDTQASETSVSKEV